MVQSFRQPVILEATKMLLNTHATVRIYSNTPGSKFQIMGFIQNGLQLSSQAFWQQDFEGMNNDAAKAMRMGQQALGAIGPVRDLINKLSPGLMATSLKSNFATLKSYGGTATPMFSVSFLSVAFTSKINPLDIVTLVQAMNLPRETGNLFIEAPLGYQPFLSNQEFSGVSEGDAIKQQTPLGGPGTLTVAIGNYFFGVGLISDNNSCTLSEEVAVDDNGFATPLYAMININFSPKRLMSIAEYRRYFIGLDRTFEKQLDNSTNVAIATANKTFDDVSKITENVADFVTGTVTKTSQAIRSLFGNPSF